MDSEVGPVGREVRAEWTSDSGTLVMYLLDVTYNRLSLTKCLEAQMTCPLSQVFYTCLLHGGVLWEQIKRLFS